jgi:ribosome-binding protein aMBF1 (putative translation factor)
MTVVPRRTMGDRCPICNKDISQQEVIEDYPNLCKKCADYERELKTRRKDGRVNPPGQQSLF